MDRYLIVLTAQKSDVKKQKQQLKRQLVFSAFQSLTFTGYYDISKHFSLEIGLPVRPADLSSVSVKMANLGNSRTSARRARKSAHKFYSISK